MRGFAPGPQSPCGPPQPFLAPLKHAPLFPSDEHIHGRAHGTLCWPLACALPLPCLALPCPAPPKPALRCVSRRSLGLWENKIQNPLPNSLSALQKLTYFSVASNILTSIPDSISELTNLQCVLGARG